MNSNLIVDVPPQIGAYRSTAATLKETRESLLYRLGLLLHTDYPPRVVHTEHEQAAPTIGEGTDRFADCTEIASVTLELSRLILTALHTL